LRGVFPKKWCYSPKIKHFGPSQSFGLAAPLSHLQLIRNFMSFAIVFAKKQTLKIEKWFLNYNLTFVC